MQARHMCIVDICLHKRWGYSCPQLFRVQWQTHRAALHAMEATYGVRGKSDVILAYLHCHPNMLEQCFQQSLLLFEVYRNDHLFQRCVQG